jgi:hypothetical protein
MADYNADIDEVVTVSESLTAATNGGVNTLPVYGPVRGSDYYRGRDAVVVDVGYRSAGLTLLYYRMRAWNLNTNDWELWTSADAPSLTPPSGDPITDWSIVAIWEA